MDLRRARSFDGDAERFTIELDESAVLGGGAGRERECCENAHREDRDLLGLRVRASVARRVFCVSASGDEEAKKVLLSLRQASLFTL